MKNSIFSILIFLCASTMTLGQTVNKVTYERSTYWIKIMSSLPFYTKADIDRQKLTWGKEDGYKNKYLLKFNDEYSTYERLVETNDNGYSWKEEEYFLSNNLKTMHHIDHVNSMDKTYVIEDTLTFQKWKITNEIKEIAGYLCMSAETTDTIKNQKIKVWFSNKIKSLLGPQNYGGLPGLILGVTINDGAVIIEATSVELDTKDTINHNFGKKLKGKKVTNAKYIEHVAKYIKEESEARHNPYWNLLY